MGEPRFHLVTYRVGDYSVDLRARVLRNAEGPVAIPWRAFEALRLLVEAHGEIVTREALFAALWPGATVDESSLAKCISQLRKALGNGHGPEYVETLPRVGYRLAFPVTEVAEPGEAVEEGEPGRRGWKGAAGLAGIGLAVLVLAGAWLGWQSYQARRARREEAQTLLRMGDELLAKRDGNMGAAVLAFQRSAEIEPTAHAYSQMGWAIHRMANQGQEKREQTALQAAEKCLQYGAEDADCNGTVGFLAFYEAWDWKKSERYLRHALELKPEASTCNGLAMMLTATGRVKEGLKMVEAALSEGGFYASRYTVKANLLYFDGRYEEAIEAANRALALDGNYRPAADWRALSQLQLGRDEAAVETYARLYPEEARRVEAAFRRAGRKGALEELVKVTDEWPQRVSQCFRRARWKAMLGDRAGSVAELNACLEKRNPNLMFVGADPVFAGMRGDAGFRKVLGGMGLAEYFGAR